ncbi:MAG: ribonuclease P protein component [Microlunatus sp.]|nr:ribonuclease P protein component [Microlunatus sp.]
MLPRPARMHRTEDFRRTVRRGVRAGRGAVVVHAWRGDSSGTGIAGGRSTCSGVGSVAPRTVGFVVSKAVGPAVRRNRVRRRLRHLARRRLGELDEQTQVVGRALPAAGTAGRELANDLDAAWSAAVAKLDQRVGLAGRARLDQRSTSADRSGREPR